MLPLTAQTGRRVPRRILQGGQATQRIVWQLEDELGMPRSEGEAGVPVRQLVESIDPVDDPNDRKLLRALDDVMLEHGYTPAAVPLD